MGHTTHHGSSHHTLGVSAPISLQGRVVGRRSEGSERRGKEKMRGQLIVAATTIVRRGGIFSHARINTPLDGRFLTNQRGLVTSIARLGDGDKADTTNLAQKVDPKDAAAKKAAEEATKKAEEAAAAKKKEIEAAAAKKKAEEEAAKKKAAAEKAAAEKAAAEKAAAEKAAAGKAAAEKAAAEKAA